ncbi:glycoside hydrolase family 15 protein [Angustibacter sp. McL0619]|uniref:glycoside hydrolase family 15 protein n=1 Tax=Angustibacter sp. McL0619 TaxID=3415676 RepID=UPI003CEA34A4
MPARIEEYAIIGDTTTSALVSADGSVDWACLPRSDSHACFAALLGDPQHGRWLLTPDRPHTTTRRYLDHSFVLETTHTTEEGVVRIVDAMPIGDERADIVRRVEGVSGSVRMRHEWVVRFGYGKVRPWVHRIVDPHGHPALHAIAGPDMLVLRGARLPTAGDGRHSDVFDVGEGEVMAWSTTWFPGWQAVPEPLDIDERIEATRIRWNQWASTCQEDGAYQEEYLRSLLVLRLLTDAETGGIVAAPTTSLPEALGGERNWDYRFCWLRDASLTLEALLEAGFTEEAEEWRRWLLRAVAGDPEDLQIMYRVDGGRELPERVLAHLPGYEGSLPVRVGNAAVDQRQSDVLGEVMSALHVARERGLDESLDSWALQRKLVAAQTKTWEQPDNGIWEIRGEPQHFTHSKIMVWAALDRAVRAMEHYGLPGPMDEWRQLRDEVHAQVLERGWDDELGSFVQFYGAKHTDASLLQLVRVGFLPADDSRVLATIAAIERELLVDGYLLRYRTEHDVDGLPPGEAPFLACSFWLAEAYARCGRKDDAKAMLDRLCGLANDVGLLSEEYDPRDGRMLGNFPQALSHLALVGAVSAYRKAR